MWKNQLNPTSHAPKHFLFALCAICRFVESEFEVIVYLRWNPVHYVYYSKSALVVVAAEELADCGFLIIEM